MKGFHSFSVATENQPNRMEPHMCAKKPVYSRASFQRFLGRHRLLFPVGLLSCPFLGSHQPVFIHSRNTCALHSVLFWIHKLIFCILHFSLISSFFTLSILFYLQFRVEISSHILPIFLLFLWYFSCFSHICQNWSHNGLIDAYFCFRSQKLV